MPRAKPVFAATSSTELQACTLLSRMRRVAGSKSITASGVMHKRGPPLSPAAFTLSGPSRKPGEVTKSTFSTKVRGECTVVQM